MCWCGVSGDVKCSRVYAVSGKCCYVQWRWTLMMGEYRLRASGRCGRWYVACEGVAACGMC